MRPKKKTNNTTLFIFLFVIIAVAACNELVGIEPGKLALCVEGSGNDVAHCEEANPDGAGGSAGGENGAMSSSGGAGMWCATPWQRGDPVTGRCYLQEAMPRGWALAEQRCVELGGHLVAINSAQELGYLAEWINADVWIGGTDATNEGEFVWTNEQPWSFASWKDGLPSDPHGNRDCVALTTPSGSLPVFNCRPCLEKRAYICESPPNNP